MKPYVAYTDGSYQSSIGAGGYSSIIITPDGKVKKYYQGYLNTTNNRMELMGVITALKETPCDCVLDIYSDSQYVINNVKYAKGWFEEEEYDKKNLDLWFQLVDLLEDREVYFHWVKGHNDDEYNEMADMLAVHAAQCLNLPQDLKNNDHNKDAEDW